MKNLVPNAVDGFTVSLMSDGQKSFVTSKHRESGGYRACRLDVDVGERTTKAWVWIALPDNPHSVPNESVESTVEVMLTAHGQSGPNIDYVLNLECALEEAGISDAEVVRYATLLRRHVSESSSD